MPLAERKLVALERPETAIQPLNPNFRRELVGMIREGASVDISALYAKEFLELLNRLPVQKNIITDTILDGKALMELNGLVGVKSIGPLIGIPGIYISGNSDVANRYYMDYSPDKGLLFSITDQIVPDTARIAVVTLEEAAMHIGLAWKTAKRPPKLRLVRDLKRTA